MDIYFNAKGLRYEDGRIVLISYFDLLNECLKHPFDTVSISTIIFETITDMTGKKVIKKNYSQNKLYRWLEKNIMQDERYIQAKAESRKKNSLINEKRKQYDLRRKFKGRNHTLNMIELRRLRQDRRY